MADVQSIKRDHGIECSGFNIAAYEALLSPEAMNFLAALQHHFNEERLELLAQRQARQQLLLQGKLPDFLPETAEIRANDWQIAPIPMDLQDRRVEITGPVDRKMVINALNSGAKIFMADFEDSCSPTISNLLDGQMNLQDAVAGTISYTDSVSGKHYALGQKPAVLLVRPRGLHMEEQHFTIAGKAFSASLFDFGLYVFHNIQALKNKGSGAYFYLPKLESHHEAAWWSKIFHFTEQHLNLAQGSLRCTVLIETILAAFEMDEILYALKEHICGLNCGRWDYIFSFIKKLGHRPDKILPDRHIVTMTTHFLRSYSLLAIKTCHRRGAAAMGGMAAFIPIKDDAAANEQVLARVRADKEREAGDGHDGTWVAHPGLVPVAMEVFNRLMPTPNQIHRQRDDVVVQAADLLIVPEGGQSLQGVSNNVAVGLGYLEAWLRGVGCVPLFNLMEDAATAEISRAQLWQWLKHGVILTEGMAVNREFIEKTIEAELLQWKTRVGDVAYNKGKFAEAATLLRQLVYSENFVEFLTLPAYQQLLAA
ncbi:MAG: malate synthase A [Alphaproteobacteria bacterium]